MPSSDHHLYQIEGFLVSLAASAYVLSLLARGLRRQRPDLVLGRVVTVAFGIRLFVAAGVSLIPNGRALRGPDELLFLSNAQSIRASPLVSILTGHGINPLHQWLFAVQQRLFDASDLTLRTTQITLSVVGLMLLAGAVHELAGGRRAQIAAWTVALEPTNIFYSSFLHKEPLITLGLGLIAYGGTMMWTRRSLPAVGLMGAGCAVSTLARPYAGWFLIAACVAISLHTAMRRQHGRRAAITGFAIAGLVMVFVPVALRLAPAQLEKLKLSQTANTTNASNLKYDNVDYSSPVAILQNLPSRIAAFVLRPYPWELQNTNQRLGAIGGLVSIGALCMFLVSILRHRARIMTRAGPLVYMTASLIVAYAVTAGNAGTAFRLRENVTAMLICVVCSLDHRGREVGLEREQAPAPLIRHSRFAYD